MNHHDGTAEEILARIAFRQHGVVTRWQALRAGVTPDELRHRLRVGALLRVHPGVYRVGHAAPSVEATYMAAVLACGDDALLCGPAAAWLWRLVKGASPRPEVLARTARRIPGVVVHRTRVSSVADRGRCRGIPVTTVARTVVDVAGAFGDETLMRAGHEADVLYGITPDHIEAVLARRPGTPGSRRLRRLVHGDVHITLSTLERTFVRLLRDAGLPLPRTNIVASGRRVDCRWPDHRLTVELDSYRFHRSRYAWEHDHRRERQARARGDDFRRFTYGDVVDDPTPMLDELALFFAGRPVLLGRDPSTMGWPTARRGS